MDIEDQLRNQSYDIALVKAARMLSSWPWQLSPRRRQAVRTSKSKLCAVGWWVSRGNNL
jgi:hypothetical protein